MRFLKEPTADSLSWVAAKPTLSMKGQEHAIRLLKDNVNRVDTWFIALDNDLAPSTITEIADKLDRVNKEKDDIHEKELEEKNIIIAKREVEIDRYRKMVDDLVMSHKEKDIMLAYKDEVIDNYKKNTILYGESAIKQDLIIKEKDDIISKLMEKE